MGKQILDLKARQNAGEHMVCPRCGYDRMKPRLVTNALSRHADLYICDECGTAEALLDFMNNPLPLENWACFQPDRPHGDFKAVPGEKAWEEIRVEQGPFLIKLFDRWLNEHEHEDFHEYRVQAFKNCKGLSGIWETPFHVTYEVADGTLMLRFKRTETGTEVACDLVGDKK